MPAFIELRKACFSYHVPNGISITALQDVDLTIQEGEFVTIIGQNGSGKSTLARMFNALLLPDEGEVLVSGMDTRERINHSIIRSAVGMSFQRPQDQIVATTVEEDTAFGPSNLALPPEEIRTRVRAALDQTGLSAYRERPTYMLSAGEMQRLALAGVLAMQPRCVIFDETTAMLDPAGRKMVMQQAKSLHESGRTIIFITHLMEEAARAERLIALHKGRVSLDGKPREIFSSASRLADIGLDLPPAAKAANQLRWYVHSIPDGIIFEEELASYLPEYNGGTEKIAILEQPPANEKAIEVNGLSYEYMRGTPVAHQAIQDLSLDIQNDSAHGLIGPTGSGKSTLLQHFNGLMRPQQGSVRVMQFDLTDKDEDMRALRRTAALVFQQPEDQIFEQYVGDEVAYAPKNFNIEGELATIVREAMLAVGLDFEEYKDRLTSTLSGGERRKVALASVLAAQPKILLLDEPMAGLDPRSRSELAAHFSTLRKHRLTLVISTHQYDEIAGMLGQVTVLAEGSDRIHGSPGQVFTSQKALEELGLNQPLAVRIADMLRSKGWPVSPETVSMPLLQAALDKLAKGKTA